MAPERKHTRDNLQYTHAERLEALQGSPLLEMKYEGTLEFAEAHQLVPLHHSLPTE